VTPLWRRGLLITANTRAGESSGFASAFLASLGGGRQTAGGPVAYDERYVWDKESRPYRPDVRLTCYPARWAGLLNRGTGGAKNWPNPGLGALVADAAPPARIRAYLKTHGVSVMVAAD
jgi:hypothetical protein